MASSDTKLIIDHLNELRGAVESLRVDGGQKKGLTISKTGSTLSNVLLTVSKPSTKSN